MEPMPPRRMLRTNRFRSNRTGKEEKKEVTSVIRFKVKKVYLAHISPVRASTIRPPRRRRPRSFRRHRRPRRTYVRCRTYGASRPRPQPKRKSKNEIIEEIAEDYLDKSGMAFPCGLRKSGKTTLGKKPKPPQHTRRPWQVKMAQSSQCKKHKHKRGWKRRGLDIDFGL